MSRLAWFVNLGTVYESSRPAQGVMNCGWAYVTSPNMIPIGANVITCFPHQMSPATYYPHWQNNSFLYLSDWHIAWSRTTNDARRGWSLEQQKCTEALKPAETPGWSPRRDSAARIVDARAIRVEAFPTLADQPSRWICPITMPLVRRIGLKSAFASHLNRTWRSIPGQMRP